LHEIHESRTPFQLLAGISPVFSLDYYRYVLDAIMLLPFKKKSDLFSESELLDYLSRPEGGSNNSYILGIASRAQFEFRNVMDQIASIGLVVKTEGGLKKADYFDATRGFIRLFSSPDQRLLIWCLHYLGHSGVNNFRTSDILNLIQYDEMMIEREINYQLDWKGDERSYLASILRRMDGKFILDPDENLRRIREKKLLAHDCNTRILVALSEISEYSKETTTKEILSKLSDLEKHRAEAVLIHNNLHLESGRWIVGSETLKRIQNELRESSWPYYNISYFKDSIVKIGSNSNFVDLPNSKLWEFWLETRIICEEHKEELNTAYSLALTRIGEQNAWLDSYLGGLVGIENGYKSWVSLGIRRNPTGTRRFVIQTNIRWDEFFDFLEALAASERLKLFEKYEYLDYCKAPASMVSKDPTEIERVQGSVKPLVTEELSIISNALEELRNEIEQVRKRLANVSQRKRIGFYTSRYIPEMLTIVQGLQIVAEKGAIPSCYREMRKLIENLCWAISDDILTLRGLNSGSLDGSFQPPFANANRRWFDWSREGEGRRIATLSALQKKVDNILKGIEEPKRAEIIDILFKNMTYPLLICLASAEIEENIPDYVERYDPSILSNAIDDLKRIIGDKSHGRAFDALANLIQRSTRGKKSIIPCIFGIYDVLRLTFQRTRGS
jgi:hypothetical protein